MDKFRMWIDILSKIATIIVCVVAILGYIFTIKPTYDLKMLEKEAENLKKEKVELSGYIDSSKEKIKKYETDIKSKKQEISTLDKELDNIEKEHYNMIVVNLLDLEREATRILINNLGNTPTTEIITHTTKQPKILVEYTLNKLIEKQQNPPHK